MHLIDAPVEQVAPRHQRGGAFRCCNELLAPPERGQLVGDAGAVALVVARDREHQLGLGEPDIADRHYRR